MTGLVAQAKEAGACLVYVNDNHGDWTAGREALTEWALQGADPSLVKPITPDDDVPILRAEITDAGTALECLIDST
jgi:hypothetical protein